MSAADKQRAAFYAELEANPDVAPGPTALNKRLGNKKKGAALNKLYWSGLRIELLLQNGFGKDSSGHWVKHVHTEGEWCPACEMTLPVAIWRKSNEDSIRNLEGRTEDSGSRQRQGRKSNPRNDRRRKDSSA